MLPSTYFPTHEENRMQFEGQLEKARQTFIDQRPSNLDFLLEQRYAWMNQFLDGREKVVELGAGAGFSRFYIRNANLKLTDVTSYDWIDEYVDALDLPFEKESIDACICSHMIHHVAKPAEFLSRLHDCLKPGGVIVISEINTSFFMRLLLWIMRHEGWSYDVDVFDRNKIANHPDDPWSANCAIPELLFADHKKFEEQVPGLKVIKDDLGEFLIFPLSGGVIAKFTTINLPKFLLRGVHLIDRALIAVAPRIFAMGRHVVLQKNP